MRRVACIDKSILKCAIIIKVAYARVCSYNFFMESQPCIEFPYHPLQIQNDSYECEYGCHPYQEMTQTCINLRPAARPQPYIGRNQLQWTATFPCRINSCQLNACEVTSSFFSRNRQTCMERTVLAKVVRGQLPTAETLFKVRTRRKY